MVVAAAVCTCLHTQNVHVARLKMDLPFHTLLALKTKCRPACIRRAGARGLAPLLEHEKILERQDHFQSSDCKWTCPA